MPAGSSAAKVPASPAATTLLSPEATTHRPPEATPHLSPEATLHRPAEATPPGADATAPLELTVWARTEGSHEGPFKNAMRLRRGDRLYFDGQASKPAYVYMLHCDERQMLERLPQRGYIPLSARQRSELPERYQYFEVDGHEGEEVIYVVASERPLADDGPAFYEALTRGPQQEAVRLDCGRPRARLGHASPGASVLQPNVPGQNSPPSPPAALPLTVMPASHQTAASPPEQPSIKPPSDPVAKALRGTPVKGGASVSAIRADRAGIVVMRFSFEH
ncbi:MAG TPA: DUF4384 domain-containing protein [Polyangiaceae bacterium]|nr:DUF4384 domain-containing protein [Polyangiaceae bacterium]